MSAFTPIPLFIPTQDFLYTWGLPALAFASGFIFCWMAFHAPLRQYVRNLYKSMKESSEPALNSLTLGMLITNQWLEPKE